MHLTCQTRELLAAVNIVQRAVDLHSTIPILTNIKLSATTDQAEVIGTDLELSIRATLAAKVNEAGTTVLPTRLLADLLRHVGSSEVSLTQGEEKTLLQISYGRARASLNTLTSSDFPRVPLNITGVEIPLSTSIFKRMVRHVLVSVGRDNPRLVFSGVLLDIDQGNLTMVATDSHRLSVIRESYQEGASPFKAIIPYKALTEIDRLLPAEGEVAVGMNENYLVYEGTSFSLATRLLDGQFPNWQAVIPSSYLARVRCLRQELLSAVERASLLSSDPSRGWTSLVFLHLSDDLIHINASSSELGEAHEEVLASVEGSCPVVAFNGRYLAEALSSETSEEVYLELTGSEKPVLIKPVQEDDNKQGWRLHMVLPVRTNT